MDTAEANPLARGASPLDDLIVLQPWGELGYQQYHAHLAANPDYGYLINQGRVFTAVGGYAHSNPQGLLASAMKGAINGRKVPKFKRVLWLEHDHTFPLDVFQKHATYAEPWVSGLYVFRDPREPIPVVYKWDEARQSLWFYNAPELEEMGIFDALDSSRRGLHRVDMTPMGCLSVRRDVYEAWPADRPFFSSGTTPGGITVGHDVFAARIVEDLGFPRYVDTTMRVKHYAWLELDDTYFAQWYRTVRVPAAIKELEEANAAQIMSEDEARARMGLPPTLEVVK